MIHSFVFYTYFIKRIIELEQNIKKAKIGIDKHFWAAVYVTSDLKIIRFLVVGYIVRRKKKGTLQLCEVRRRNYVNYIRMKLREDVVTSTRNMTFYSSAIKKRSTSSWIGDFCEIDFLWSQWKFHRIISTIYIARIYTDDDKNKLK